MKVLIAIILALVGVAAAALVTPYQGFKSETYVEIAHGTGTLGIGEGLAQDGVIRYQWLFWLARATHPSAKLQAGEYRFATAASVMEVFNRIARGDIYYVEVTVPEGSNIFDIGRTLDEQGVMPAEDFLAAAEDPTLIRDLTPNARTLEGYLFPSTYRLPHTITAAKLTKLMTDEFRRQWAKLGAKQAAVNATVTLASLVEKETAASDERRLVASVFRNRLAQGMRLECDPTTIYAALLEKRYRGKIHRSDLASTNPYNTYQNAGLPPGPIANPGAPALEAALEPADTAFLFFVAKPGGGGHQFSTTMAQHEKAVVAYRHAQRKVR